MTIQRPSLGRALVFLPLSVLAIAACGERDGLLPDPRGLTVCCDDFTVGADLSNVDFGVDASIKGQFGVFAQASSDFSAAASAAVQDVEASCRALAADLGASQADREAAEKQAGSARMKAYCALAATQLEAKFDSNRGTFAGAGKLDIRFTEPTCSASVQAKASCQGKCDVSGTCDVRANPPTCEGGKLQVACKGECTARGNAALTCTGTCSGTCKGSCEAKGGVAVQCSGKCEGTCSANADGSGNGAQADGSCNGYCEGKCTMRANAPEVACTGTCSGECTGSCQGSAEASVTCDGECKADYEPLRCEGGTLKGGCKVDANCEANCNASASARAECTPPSLTITASGSANLNANLQEELNVALTSLRKNLPNLLVVLRARGEAFVKAGASFGEASASIASDPGKLGVKGSVCAVAIASTAAQGAANAKAAFEASASVAGKVIDR